jgi:hypothetical protein
VAIDTSSAAGASDPDAIRAGRALYVYGIVPSGAPGPEPSEAGLDAQPLSVVRHGAVSALVSPIEGRRIRPSRANVTAHQNVVDCAHRRAPVLPVRFGTVVSGAAEVRERFIGSSRDRLAELLRQVRDQDEFRFRATYREDVVLRELLRARPALRQARARMRAGRRAPGRDTMIAFGEMVRSELALARERDGSSLEAAIAPYGASFQGLTPARDTVVLYAALLIPRRGRDRFERAVEDLATSWAPRIDMELIGPLPPWDFTEIAEATA